MKKFPTIVLTIIVVVFYFNTSTLYAQEIGAPMLKIIRKKNLVRVRKIGQ